VPSSSSITPSSSSIALVASSSSIKSMIVYGDPVNYENETYQTVVIGEQTWLQRNLNYDVGNNKCYNNQDSNCTTYGRLYDWATAMALPLTCNDQYCTSQITEKHRGICPDGWHIPSDEDWNTLIMFINPDCKGNDHCVGAGAKLKSTNFWNSPYWNQASVVSTDDYGFSALPGGTANLLDDFASIGEFGYWWSTNEFSSNHAYYRYMSCNNDYAYRGDFNGHKVVLYSIRCIKD